MFEIFIKDGNYYDISYQFVSLKRFARNMSPKTVSPNLARPRLYSTKYDMLRNEKYTGRVLLQKTVSTGAVQIENDGLMEWYLYTDSHKAIISDEMFMAVQQEKLRRTKNPENTIAMSFIFC